MLPTKKFGVLITHFPGNVTVAGFVLTQSYWKMVALYRHQGIMCP